MSHKSHHSDAVNKEEHGTAKSYIAGFILSLIFTAIPYYLVVYKTINGNALLAAILGIAVLQMIIQIVFFLHLGRGPKPFYNVVFFGATVGTILVVVGGSIWIMHHLNYNMVPADVSKKLVEKEGIYQIDGEQTGACYGQHENYKVIIAGGVASPAHTIAHYCDTLTFVNEDDQPRQITFGIHPRHDTYGGESELSVVKGRSKTLTLNQAGTYLFHDHLDPEATGSFTVNP